jgi:hypothetical protein
MGRKKSANPRVFCAYRLPAAIKEEIKRRAKVERISEADAISRAIGDTALLSRANTERQYAAIGIPQGLTLDKLKQAKAILDANPCKSTMILKPQTREIAARIAEMRKLADAAETGGQPPKAEVPFTKRLAEPLKVTVVSKAEMSKERRAAVALAKKEGVPVVFVEAGKGNRRAQPNGTVEVI